MRYFGYMDGENEWFANARSRSLACSTIKKQHCSKNCDYNMAYHINNFTYFDYCEACKAANRIKYKSGVVNA